MIAKKVLNLLSVTIEHLFWQLGLPDTFSLVKHVPKTFNTVVVFETSESNIPTSSLI